MLPGEKNLNLYKGDSRVWPMHFQDAQGAPIDLTGLTWRAQIRETRQAQSAEASMNVDVIDPLTGDIEVVLPAAEADKLTSSEYFWDLESTDGQGFVQTWLQGTVTVTHDVSR